MGKMSSKNSQKRVTETLGDWTSSAHGRLFWGLGREPSHGPPQARAQASPSFSPVQKFHLGQLLLEFL